MHREIPFERRRGFIWLALAAAVIRLGQAAPLDAAPPARAPNMLLILCDDLWPGSTSPTP